MRSVLGYAIVVCSWAFFAAAGQAQVPGMPFGGGGQLARPAISPYLNLNRTGNPAINYYGLVRPQIAAAQAFQTLDKNVLALETLTSQPSQTGQRSSFMTQSRYFMNNGAYNPLRQGGQQGMAGGQQQQRPAPRGR